MKRLLSHSGGVIRDAVQADAEAVSAVFLGAALDAWSYMGEAFSAQDSSAESWLQCIATLTLPAHVIVHESGDGIDGFVWLRPSEDLDAGAGTGEVESFFTLPRVWGSGVGRDLLGAAEQLLVEAGFTDATLWTEQRNTRARAVYNRAGWLEDGTVRDRLFNEAPIHELRHRKPLNSGRVGR